VSVLNVPSPEHGASKRILSNLMSVSFAILEQKAIASFLVIIVFVTPAFSKFAARIFSLFIFSSFAIIVPLLFISAAICVVFEPGAAVKSRTKSFSVG